MIQLIYQTIFSQKLKYILLIYMFIIAFILGSMIYIDEPKYLILLDHESYLVIYQNYVIVGLKLIIPMTIILLMIDHHQDYEKMLIAYFSRMKIYVAKIIAYMSVVSLIVWSIFLYIYMGITIQSFSDFFDSKMLITFLSLYLGSMIITTYALMLIRKKRLMIAILILMVSLIVQMFLEDLPLFVFYLLPLSGMHMIDRPYTILYQTIYLCFIILMTHYKYKHEII